MKLVKKTIPVFMLVALFALVSAPCATALEIGERAPDFQLPSTKDGKFMLSSFQGKKNVLIQFYVLDFTPT